jgi:hypothetical protein
MCFANTTSFAQPTHSVAVFTDNEGEWNEHKDNGKGNPFGRSSLDIECLRHGGSAVTHTNFQFYTDADFDTFTQPHNDHTLPNSAGGRFDRPRRFPVEP